MKVTLKIASSEITVEGEIEEVDRILEDYWKPIVELISSSKVEVQLNQHESEATEVTQAPPTKRKKTKSKRSTPVGATQPEEEKQFEEELANKIKSAPNFEIIRSKFILGKASVVEKCKLIIHFSDKPVHSGNVSRVLAKLGVSLSTASASKALSNNKDSFITSGEQPHLTLQSE